jgi:hypothetical protein
MLFSFLRKELDFPLAEGIHVSLTEFTELPEFFEQNP